VPTQARSVASHKAVVSGPLWSLELISNSTSVGIALSFCSVVLFTIADIVNKSPNTHPHPRRHPAGPTEREWVVTVAGSSWLVGVLRCFDNSEILRLTLN